MAEPPGENGYKSHGYVAPLEPCPPLYPIYGVAVNGKRWKKAETKNPLSICGGGFRGHSRK